MDWFREYCPTCENSQVGGAIFFKVKGLTWVWQGADKKGKSVFQINYEWALSFVIIMMWIDLENMVQLVKNSQVGGAIFFKVKGLTWVWQGADKNGKSIFQINYEWAVSFVVIMIWIDLENMVQLGAAIFFKVKGGNIIPYFSKSIFVSSIYPIGHDYIPINLKKKQIYGELSCNFILPVLSFRFTTITKNIIFLKSKNNVFELSFHTN